ncbi:hypothetical protein MTR62_15010 [Novosphingobium sp. 1949]|uniref:Uncharacterized protein n=1 Tax=Novosphingobium organovorum TaxID=2930092 RepID=A0ABT0BGL0_9SPHN|nr:hypothetical protein [Novosphingobium organovorum]MCJ2183993.1 hypothetical protein [Novosphingobium organovorum]
MSADDPTLEELRLLHALSNVCGQYMPGRWTYVECDGFTAGVVGVQMLAEYGLVQYDAHFGGSWTTRAIIVREQGEITSENYEKVKAAYLSDDGKLLRSITPVEKGQAAPEALNRSTVAPRRSYGQSHPTASTTNWLGVHKSVAILVAALTMLVLVWSRYR